MNFWIYQMHYEGNIQCYLIYYILVFLQNITMLCLYIVARFCPSEAKRLLPTCVMVILTCHWFMLACNIIFLTVLIYGKQNTRAKQSNSSEYLLFHFVFDRWHVRSMVNLARINFVQSIYYINIDCTRGKHWKLSPWETTVDRGEAEIYSGLRGMTIPSH